MGGVGRVGVEVRDHFLKMLQKIPPRSGLPGGPMCQKARADSSYKIFLIVSCCRPDCQVPNFGCVCLKG